MPLRPSQFSITGQHDTLSNTTITLEWSPPLGRGSEAVVDFYTLSFLPIPLSHPASATVNITSVNVTVEYNVQYMFNILATNCIGESDVFILQNIKFGMGHVHNYRQVEPRTYCSHSLHFVGK